MTARRHTREELDGFLDREFRQVWALHRSSGDRLFIEPGMADLLRPVAKEHWRCPAQGCTDPISLRGKTKRDHLFHVSGSCTGGGAESMWHLQGKAMLAEWAERQPGYLTVLEEQTVKDPKTLLHRRADVMVTWPSGRALALEVEYKKAPPEQLIAKHDQYVDLGAGCTWLFGHTHLRLERRPDYLSAEAPWDLIKWTSQLRAMAARGVPLLFVNPVTRQVGTAHIAGQHELDDVLKSRRAWWEDLRFVGDRLPDAADEFGVLKLEVDDLDCCTIDPEVGLVTPTLQRIREGRAAIEAAAAPARARWEAERARREAQEAAAERRREAQAAKDQDRQARAEARSPQERKAFAKERTERDAAAWKADPLRERTLAEFDGRLPRFLADRGREDWGVHGNPEAWHSHLFEQIVLGGPERSNRVGREFKVPQAYAIVGERFPLHREPRYRSEAICSYLWLLDDIGYLRCDTWPNGTIGNITVLTNRIELPPREFTPPRPNKALEVGLAVLARHRAEAPEPQLAPIRILQQEPPPAPVPLSDHACRLCGSDLRSSPHANYCAVPPEEFHQAGTNVTQVTGADSGPTTSNC
jgi:hypothetical protein